MEPRPQKSKYLKVAFGGFACTSETAQYDLWVEMTPLDRPLYIKVEFDDPLNPNVPLVEEVEMKPGTRTLHPVSKPVKALFIKKKYKVRISLYEVDDKENPIDQVTQMVVSYVDSSGANILVKGGMGPAKQYNEAVSGKE